MKQRSQDEWWNIGYVLLIVVVLVVLIVPVIW